MDLDARCRDAAQLLGEAADPVRAAGMRRYLKTDEPCYGVRRPVVRAIARDLLRRYPLDTAESYEQTVVDLWGLGHREERYLAIDVAIGAREHVVPARLALYRRLIVEGAWWDLVDDVAIRLVGAVWYTDRVRVSPQMDRWIEDDDLWLRRTAIIGQLKHGDETDAARLLSYCAARAAEPEFFIRKAIGWALREYSRTDPDAVAAFVDTHRDRLSGLSIREATRHLDRMR